MPNIGASTNNGNQTVSIYPSQQLSSIYGNEIIYGIVQPGVANASVSISTLSSNIVFTIAAGTQFYFQRSATDPVSGAITDTFIAKITLGSSATYNFSANTTWTAGNYSASTKLYLVADWQYLSTANYVAFTIQNDSTIVNYNFTGTGNQVLVATILNNANAYNTYNTNGNILSSAITLFHIAYEGQAKRDVLPRINSKNDQFMVQFAGDGSGVYVSQGSNFIGDNFLSSETVTQAPAWDTNTSHGGDAKFVYLGQLSTDKIAPPTIYTTYANNLSTGSSLTISSGNYGNYYQVDFLRNKFDELLHIQGFYWESFLQPAGSFTFVYGSTTQQNLIDYLASAVSTGTQAYPLNGIGNTLLVSVRLLSAVNTSNLIWPESTIVFRNTGLSEVTGVNNHSRFKLPIWKASDLGLS